MKRPSVTQLVDFAKCEKLAILKISHKESLGAQRSRAVEEGIRAHDRLERQTVVDGRCFVASYAYGAGSPETAELRKYRDQRLGKTLAGRVFIQVYYALSPWAVGACRRIPGGKKIALLLVGAALAWARGRDE